MKSWKDIFVLQLSFLFTLEGLDCIYISYFLYTQLYTVVQTLCRTEYIQLYTVVQALCRILKALWLHYNEELSKYSLSHTYYIYFTFDQDVM